MVSAPRMSIFAGPNGSGKSSLYPLIENDLGIKKLGTYINADDIEAKINKDHSLALPTAINQMTSDSDWKSYLDSAEGRRFQEKQTDLSNKIDLQSKCFINNGIDKPINSYHAAAIASFLRIRLVNMCHSFSFETVLSDSSKINFIQNTINKGYKIYIYYVCLETVELNIKRIKSRVEQGGHDVPEDKIRSRYEKSLNNLRQAMKMARRTYFFDNSGDSTMLLGEYCNLPEKNQSFIRKIPSQQRLPEWLRQIHLEMYYPSLTDDH